MWRLFGELHQKHAKVEAETVRMYSVHVCVCAVSGSLPCSGDQPEALRMPASWRQNINKARRDTAGLQLSPRWVRWGRVVYLNVCVFICQGCLHVAVSAYILCVCAAWCVWGEGVLYREVVDLFVCSSGGRMWCVCVCLVEGGSPCWLPKDLFKKLNKLYTFLYTHL